jgi:predicted MPP superfamily phosphohydrolase
MTDRAGQQARHIAQTLLAQSPVYAVLGNHDFAPLAEVLREAGVTLLLNENAAIERGGQTIWIVGVDDCHYFKSHDLDLALHGLNGQAFKVFLSHSPELYEEAAQKGVDLYLAGHTHGGQICLPNGRAVIYSAAAPRKCIRGLWTHNGMIGYTSGGAGASGVGVRFNCPGEINLFTLQRTK